jgi:hypothetical protein
MFKSLRTVAVIAGILVLAFVLNPSAERHREKIKASISAGNPLAAAMRIGSLTALVSTYTSLGVASYTSVNDRLLSVGAFGVVLVIR